jgi:hypothetical protein
MPDCKPEIIRSITSGKAFDLALARDSFLVWILAINIIGVIIKRIAR